jgi:signal transduction histidine kinase
MHVLTNADQINVALESTLQKLQLWEVDIELDCPGNDLFKLFEQEPLLPGIIITKNQQYFGMISRQKFFEKMSNPYSLELYSQRPIEVFYNMLQPIAFVLPEDTLIIEATQKALERSPQLVYEPILVKDMSGRHKVANFQHLLLAYSQIHILSLAQLQQVEKKSKIDETSLPQLVQNEKIAALEQLVVDVAKQISNPINFITGSLIHATRYTQELLQLISLYQRCYPNPPAEIQTVINQIQLDSLTVDVVKTFASMKIASKQIQQNVRSLKDFSHLHEVE